MPGLKLGIDFGLSNTDVVLVEGERLVEHWMMHHAGAASEALLHTALEQGGVEFSHLEAIATTGGLHRTLPDEMGGVPLFKAGETEAVGRGGLALAGFTEALVVSAGTGTAMISARNGQFEHLTGSAVGGGTLIGLAKLLIGTDDPLEIARLAALGDTSGVDSTLVDVIGGGIGHLPPSATAVNFGRVANLSETPKPQDIAAGLMTLTAQVIGVIAVNAARAAGFRDIVIVGHLPDLQPIRKELNRVWDFYLVEPKPVVPERSGAATALGAVLAAKIRV